MDDKDAGKSQGKRQVESIPDGSSSEAEAEASVLTSRSGMGDTEKKPAKTPRLRWTAPLHEKFVEAVNQLGVADATPSTITKLMDVRGLTQSMVKSHLQYYRRSLRQQQSSEGGTLGAQQVSEGGKSGVDHDSDVIDNVQMRMKGINVPDAHKVFDKMSQRTWDSESCATQITVSSSASQHEVSSASASNIRRLDQSSRSDFTPLALDSIVQKGAKGGGLGHQHEDEDEDEDSKRALQKDKMFSWLGEEEDASPAFTVTSFLNFEINPSLMGETLSLAPGGSRYPFAGKMDWKKIPSPKFKQQITSSSAATYKEASLTESWRSDFIPYDRFVPLYKFTVFKFVLNIVKWKRRASARLAQFNNNRKDQFPGDRWFELGGLPEEKDASSNSLAIFKGKSITRTPTFQLRELAGEMRSKLESMVKLVVNIVRWKRRALSRHRNRRLIKVEDRTMNDLLQEEYVVAESPCTMPHNGSYVQDMDWDSYILKQILFQSIADNALFYCALFPPDHEFEKDTLVQLWMALGIFINEPMESHAGQLFEDCLTRGYFVFLRTNLVTGKAMYKFIQNTQSLPLSIGSHINLSMVSPEVTYASIRCCDLKDSTALLGFQRLKQLRALIFLHGHELSFKQVPRNFFLSLRELQVLDLSKTRLMELPTSIGIMKCLCFLDLSDTLIKRLPEAIGCLEKLQTLKLKGCLNISTLPKGMRKLINLRHLDFDVFRQLRSMPEGMGDLANIQTLSAFLVGVEDGCSIRQIKHMNKLSGSFCISRLENVLTKDDAEEACLSNKTQLKKIELHWSDSQDEDVVGYEKVLSSLQPNTGLEELNISCYGGLEFPSWICDPKFSQLVCITLFECENCLVLPSLGQLPSLKYLNIVNFHKLKVIDHKFYGDLGIQGYVAFPKLEKLTVENMLSLEEWSGIRSFEFPCLLNLTIKHCPKLHSICTLSCLSSLEKLEISHCAVLASCPDGKLPARVETFIIEGCPLISVKFLNGGEDWQKVAHIPHIWIDHKEISLG